MAPPARKRARGEEDKEADGSATDATMDTVPAKKLRITPRSKNTKWERRQYATELARKRSEAERHLQELRRVAKISTNDATAIFTRDEDGSITVCELSLRLAIARLHHAFTLDQPADLRGFTPHDAKKQLKLTKIHGVVGIPTHSQQNWISFSPDQPLQIDLAIRESLATLELIPNASIKSFLGLELQLIEHQQAGFGPRLVPGDEVPLQGCGWRGVGTSGLSFEQTAALLEMRSSLKEIWDEVWKTVKEKRIVPA